MICHPSRSTYAAGCRCAGCTAANTAYQRERARRREPQRVDASPVRQHILALSALHVGRRAIAEACDLNERTVQAIRNGERSVIYASTARRILDVDENCRLDNSLVDAKPTRDAIRRLQSAGYQVRFLSRKLGFSGSWLPTYSRAHKVKARTASAVERLIRLMNAGRIQRTM